MKTLFRSGNSALKLVVVFMFCGPLWASEHCDKQWGEGGAAVHESCQDKDRSRGEDGA